jgi:phosphoglycolate phosphatase
VSRYQHVIWDWNGTLLNDANLCIEVMNSMLRDRKMQQIDAQHYREIFDFPVIGYYQALGFDFKKEAFEDLAHSYCDTYDRRVPECYLHEGAVEALDHFSVRAGQQSILSSCEQGALDEAVRGFGLTERFASVIGQSDHYATGKEQAGLELMASSGVPAQQTVLIGDTLHDYEVAQALGIDCALVAIGHHSKGRLEAVCGCVVDSLDEVVAYAA